MAKRGTSPVKKAKYQQHASKIESKKRKRKAKWDSDRQRWRDDKEYQEKQKQRTEKIKNYIPGTKFHLKAENEARVNEENEQIKRRRKFKRLERKRR